MAVPHFSVSIVARGKGASAVMSAAYRHCARMSYEREGRIVDYTRKQGLIHEELAVPDDAPRWLKTMIAERSVAGASEAFWNRVEDVEKRSDAQLARDLTIALPRELTPAANIALVRVFVSQFITRRGMVADWVFHDVPGNPHVHMMTTLRPLTEDGFGQKKVAVAGADGAPLRNASGKILYQLWAGDLQDFNALRDGWFACQNHHLALSGIDLRVDGRSYERQGITLEPTLHLGVETKAIERKAKVAKEKILLDRLALQDERRLLNTQALHRNPSIVLDMISREKSVFDIRDVAKILSRYIDDPFEFQGLMARVFERPEVLRLDQERIDFATGARLPAKYTVRELIRLEAEMAKRAMWLCGDHSRGVALAIIDRVFARHERLSGEQRAAISHVAGCERIAAVVGRAGAGKTTMMKAAREAWEAAGYQVVGAALAGKAAEGLEKEAGIVSHTLASLELAFENGGRRLTPDHVFVLDEAGMVSSRQMAFFVEAITRAGAKLVLVGDPEQLQPIEAGAAFRAIADRIGYAELETIYRQQHQWMRDASLDLARGKTAKALEAYDLKGRLIGAEMKADAVQRLIADWSHDYDPAKSMLMLAHLRRDVTLLNRLARDKLIQRGIVEPGSVFRTSEGERRFAAGDQIIFLKNEGSIGVKNGMLGRVVEASPGRLVVEVGEANDCRRVEVEARFYNHLDHGYATTVHKAQGATVDRVKLLASLSLDRHLTYVGMTRHREDLGIYYGRRSFSKAGGLGRMLSRRNAKETTLDYGQSRFYRAALSFAEARGLHLLNVARTLARDRLEWTLRQGEKLKALGARLAAAGRLIRYAMDPGCADAGAGLAAARSKSEGHADKPLVAGSTIHEKPIAAVVEERLQADPVLSRQWADLSLRFHLVYAEPESAFATVDLTSALRDRSVAERLLTRIVASPEAFGALNGKAGFFASGDDRAKRETALKNVAALADSLRLYMRQRTEGEARYLAEETALRKRAAISIPSPSTAARAVLDRFNAAPGETTAAALVGALPPEGILRKELEDLAAAVAERFGERRFLPLAAAEPRGEVFRRVTQGMNAQGRQEVEQAWKLLRSVQQLAVHMKIAKAEKASETLRMRQGRGLSLQ